MTCFAEEIRLVYEPPLNEAQLTRVRLRAFAMQIENCVSKRLITTFELSEGRRPPMSSRRRKVLNNLRAPRGLFQNGASGGIFNLLINPCRFCQLNELRSNISKWKHVLPRSEDFPRVTSRNTDEFVTKIDGKAEWKSYRKNCMRNNAQIVTVGKTDLLTL